MPFAWLAAITVFVLALPLLLLFLKDALAKRRNRVTPQQLEQHNLEHRQRLLNPDWDAVQTRLEAGIIIPNALKASYADANLLLLEPHEVLAPNGVKWLVHGFYPADAAAVRQDQNFPHNAFWFADADIFGEYFVVLWNEDVPTPVFVSGEHGIEAVAPSLETFLSWPRINTAML